MELEPVSPIFLGDAWHARLRQFQAAVVKGTSGGRKRPAPEVETAKKSDDPRGAPKNVSKRIAWLLHTPQRRGKRRKLTKAKAAESEKAKVAKDEKGLESKAKSLGANVVFHSGLWWLVVP